MKNQLTEILGNYGPIDILFLDWSYPGEFGKGRADWGAEELVALARRLQPQILINDRADLRDIPGGYDFVTPEQTTVPQWPMIDGRRVPWEVCHTFSGSWGYNRDETTWKGYLARPLPLDRQREQGRQHDPQRRPDRARHLRRPRAPGA